MGFIGKTLKAGVGVGALAAGIGAWAVAPRPTACRRSFGHDSFPDVAFAHRGLHDAGSGLPAKDDAAAAEYVALTRSMAIRAGFAKKTTLGVVAPENSMAAFAAACEAGFGIELDVQLSADGEVVVLHDATLQRVAGDPRAVRELTYAQLERIPLFPEDDSSTSARKSKSFQHVPLFKDVLDLVGGRVPLIVEYKMGDELDRELMEKGDELLRQYEGWYCIESFNPKAVAWYRQNHSEVLRGQLAAPARGGVRDIANAADAARWCAGNLLLNWVGRPDFVAYDWHGGRSLALKAAKALGAIPVAWTVRNEAELLESEFSFDFLIFESFVPSMEY